MVASGRIAAGCHLANIAEFIDRRIPGHTAPSVVFGTIISTDIGLL